MPPQDVDEPWPLEVFDHAGKAHQAVLHPGEMLLYEGATCAHGRPAPLNGRFMANVFVHFMERTQTEA
jgi:prolyl 4-hydroxylase